MLIVSGLQRSAPKVVQEKTTNDMAARSRTVMEQNYTSKFSLFSVTVLLDDLTKAQYHLLSLKESAANILMPEQCPKVQ